MVFTQNLQTLCGSPVQNLAHRKYSHMMMNKKYKIGQRASGVDLSINNLEMPFIGISAKQESLHVITSTFVTKYPKI